MTARWVVDEVRDQRDVNITWQPISLLVKNKPEPGSEYFQASEYTHKLLRVMESVRNAEGDAAVEPLYWEMGRRIHHDGSRDSSATELLEAVGLSTDHAAAFDDESFDAQIEERMNIGLGLTGDDVGTPIIAMDDINGDRVALFGPVITRVPKGDQALQMWDSFVGMAQIPGFWEVKRTRTERPEFGERP